MLCRLLEIHQAAKAKRQYCPHSLSPQTHPWCFLGLRDQALQGLHQLMPACQTAISAGPPPRPPLGPPPKPHHPQSKASSQLPLQQPRLSMHSMRASALCQQSTHSRSLVVPPHLQIMLRALPALPLNCSSGHWIQQGARQGVLSPHLSIIVAAQ